MSDLWVIVPAKRAALAKSRLASVLDERRRTRLVSRLLHHVLATIKRAAPAAGIVGGIVVSRDPHWLVLARRYGLLPLVESGHGVNAAVQQGVHAALRRGAGAVLILPLDLPRLTPSDIVACARAGRHAPAIVLAPDHANLGTNALLVRPPALIRPTFEGGSAQRHQRQVARLGLTARILRRPGLMHDLDTLDDWRSMAHLFAHL
nr:2-phospho-L-lactate guanylyltransferase [Ardenticatena sp.]